MSRAKNPSIAVLKRDDGAARIGRSGSTVDTDLTAVEAASAQNGSDIDALETGLTGAQQNIATLQTTTNVVQGRARIDYWSATEVAVFVPDSLVMAGFRMFGSYRKPNGKTVASGADGRAVISVVNDLGLINTRKLNNWYAVFAVANDADSQVTFLNAPFFRVNAVTGNAVTLGDGAETAGETPAATTYDLTTNALAGASVLVIQEGGQWSGRTTTVTANTNGEITLADAGTLAAGDFVLVQPPGYDHAVYLGSWYLDSAEPRNRADTGQKVGTLGGQIPTLTAAGAISAEKCPVRGLVSPLATAYVGKLSYSLSTSGTGDVVHIFDHDSSAHSIARISEVKASTSTETHIPGTFEVPFSREQAVWITSAGSLQGSVSNRQFQCYGWVEP